MRTIKFRGKCAKDSRYAGEWVEGGVLQCQKSDDVLIVSAITDTCSCTYHVDPATVGQFTGMHDRFGSEIYEGDILEELDTRLLVKVVYDAPMFCYADNEFGYRFLNLPKNFRVMGKYYDDVEYWTEILHRQGGKL